MISPDHGLVESVDFRTYPVKVLLIDDQAIVAEAVRRMLAEETDIQLFYCQDPSQAMRMAMENRPTVILQDLIMPEIDGLTLVKYFRANKKLREIPLIVLSSKEDAVTKAEAFSLGANDYLVKLPDKIELIARIRYHSNAYIMMLQRNEAYEALFESRQSLVNELDQAARYVQSLLPERLHGPIKTDYVFIPSTSLGGDAFGYHWIDRDHFAMYLLDVCGHGVGAALLSVSVLNTLRSHSLDGVDFRDPGAVLGGLNEVYQMEHHNEMFSTVWYGIYHERSNVLKFASGGHPPPVALMGASRESAEVIRLQSGGVIIGGMPGQKYRNEEIELMPFTKIYIYSDGAYEIRKPGGAMWALDDFIKTVGEVALQENAVVGDIMKRVVTIQEKDAFDDDVSLLEIAFEGKTGAPEAP
ncbi:MAG TPA: SpoIIE family protein phosphatase [Deltaproteobacteria bacterium]|nr:SpoIIE family protein phosphatase [Deltaproteobacteria bacterium]HIJ41978.1 SpoIIE family protein phosphatase [Deltaproteobacteria bacterium]